MSNDHSHGYVDRVREDTQNYIRRLLSENEQLRLGVVRLESELLAAREDLSAARSELTRRDLAAAELERTVAQTRAESDQFMAQYAELETNNTNLANLYVASYQLHGTLEREAVLMAMQEIIVNLVGSEEFAICEVNGEELKVLTAVGLEEGVISWSTPRVETVVSSRVLHLGNPGDRDPGDPLVCIPLQLDGRVVGVIIILNLLAHKSQLEPLDHELFSLLATHAATALYCTSLVPQVEATPAT